MYLDDLGADALLGLKLGRRQEEVVEEPPFGDVELVKELNQGRPLKALITKPLPDMGPVLLLDMGVVILLVGS